jgi:hypothetical protein
LRSAVAYGFIRATVYETAAVTRTNGPNAYREFGHRAALVLGCHPTENCGIFATEDFSQAWVIVESKFLATQTRNNNLEACLDGYLDVSSSLWINVGKTTFPDVCLLPMWLARVKLETAAMTKHFVEAKVLRRRTSLRGNRLQFSTHRFFKQNEIRKSTRFVSMAFLSV